MKRARKMTCHMGIEVTQRRTEVPQLPIIENIPDSERCLFINGGGGGAWVGMEVALVGEGGVFSTSIV